MTAKNRGSSMALSRVAKVGKFYVELAKLLLHVFKGLRLKMQSHSQGEGCVHLYEGLIILYNIQYIIKACVNSCSCTQDA